MPPVDRWYVRCLHCLSVAAVTEHPSTADTLCGLCDGPIEIMGRVAEKRLVRDEYGTPCDDRCTFAKGPDCECHCAGKNHGSRMVVHIIQDAGPVPRVGFPDTWKARAIARDYRAARDAARAELDPLVIQRRSGYLPRADFDRMRALQNALGRAYEARSQETRMRALRAVIGQLAPTSPAIDDTPPTAPEPWTTTAAAQPPLF
jgi:hypothetical protein